MFNKEVLVVEISGKRPGDKNNRPTEKFNIQYDHLIISNNSESYISEWEIVNVPEDYEKWYKDNVKTNDKSYYAPMNRSYAIKYAKEHGYKYLIQLDDNITMLQFAYMEKEINYGVVFSKTYRSISNANNYDNMMNDYIDCLILALKCTNAGISGCNVCGGGAPCNQYLSERYVYSLFALKLDVIPNEYQGDFEDDIEFRLKLNQMNIPSIQICPLMYGKTAQNINKDLTGCRKAYAEVGTDRGKNMRKLYGDIYSAGTSNHSNRVGKQKCGDQRYFRHKIKRIKLGLVITNYELKKQLDENIKNMLNKYATKRENSLLFLSSKKQIEKESSKNLSLKE